MDPIVTSTAVTNTLGAIFTVASKIGTPPLVLAAIGALIALLTLIRFGKAIKVEKAPPPVSDGGSAEDEERRVTLPAKPDPKAKNDLNDGGDAG